MGKWENKYTPMTEINGGNRYKLEDIPSEKPFNSAIENSHYAVMLAKNTPNVENANAVGVPSVEIETMADGTPRLKFLYLKGQQGEQGQRGEQGVQGERSNICMSYDTYVRGKTYKKIDTNPRAKRNDIVIFQNKYVATVGWESGDVFTVVDDTAITIQGATGEKGDVNLTQLNDACLVPSDLYVTLPFKKPTTTEQTFTAQYNGHLIINIFVDWNKTDEFRWRYSNNTISWFRQTIQAESWINLVIPMRKGQSITYQMRNNDADNVYSEFRLSQEVK